MKNTTINERHSVCDILLAYILEFSCECECPWVRYGRLHVDRGELLKLLAAMTTLSKNIRENVAYTMQHAALRLASHDVQFVDKDLSSIEKKRCILQKFDTNMNIFTRNWKIDSPIPDYLCTSSLHELSVEDLHHLRELIHGGWTYEITARRGHRTSNSLNVWITPTHRGWGTSLLPSNLIFQLKIITLNFFLKNILILCKRKIKVCRKRFRYDIIKFCESHQIRGLCNCSKL